MSAATWQHAGFLPEYSGASPARLLLMESTEKNYGDTTGLLECVCAGERACMRV